MATRKVTAIADQDASIFDSIGPGIDPVPGPGFFLQGTAGNDYITGTSLADTIMGLAGNDHLYGEGGDDVIDGGLGDDYLVGGRGADMLIGGAGIDTASYTTATAAVDVSLASGGNRGDAYGDTYNGIENVIGSNFNDYMVGDAGDNTLNGGRGNDTLIGGRGQDTLIGGAGRDYLIGDWDGGYARDIFMITREGSGVYDKIGDFQSSTDKIALSGFNRLAFGDDRALGTGNLFRDGVSHYTENLNASDTLYFDTFTQTLYAVEVQMEDGRAHIVSAEALVEVYQPPLDLHQPPRFPAIETYDIIFVV